MTRLLNDSCFGPSAVVKNCILFQILWLYFAPAFLPPKIKKPYFPCVFDHGIICYCPLSPATVNGRCSAQAALWPPLPDRLTACQRVWNLGTVTGHQPCQISDSLGVCVCVGYCGEGYSAYDSLMFRVVLSWFFTADHTWPRSGPGCFCSGHSPFGALPLAVAELHSLAPETRHVLWSGSPWADVHHGNA